MSALYKVPLRGPTVLCYLKAIYLLLHLWCLSGSHQSISGILLHYEHLGLTGGWFLMHKDSEKPSYFELQAKWIGLLLSPRNYLPSIFQLKVKRWMKTLWWSITVFCSHCQWICSLHTCLSIFSRSVLPTHCGSDLKSENFPKGSGNLSALPLHPQRREL